MLDDPKKKRGRKKKSTVDEPDDNDSTNITIQISEQSESTTSNKKRGRKPKGGKLIMKQSEQTESSPVVANVILHLKCSLNDVSEHDTQMNQLVTDPLKYNPTIPPSIMTYDIADRTTFSNFSNEETLKITSNVTQYAYGDYQHTPSFICSSCKSNKEENSRPTRCDEDENDSIDLDDDPTITMKSINAKLKKIKLQLYKNTNPDKKSACFWCTYEYDNHTCYIPKYEIDGQLYGYGSFCRPECAVAYLMKDNIDDSTKFERYHLLNQLYSKVFNFKKNIKPAPNPYFLLEKFYGNLTIQEYRKLLKSEHMLYVVEKPMTRILPELHEDNEEFIMNIYGAKQPTTAQQTGCYKVKRQSEKQKGPSKSSIMKDNFGLT
jgi:hypothetical protein